MANQLIHHIDLSIPARAGLLQLVRLTAGVVATKVELGLDDLEELRLGVEELCLSLMGPTANPTSRLMLRYAWDDEMIEITCTLEVEPDTRDSNIGDSDTQDRDLGDGLLRRELSRQILDTVVDEHGETHDEGHHTAWIRMRRARTDSR